MKKFISYILTIISIISITIIVVNAWNLYRKQKSIIKKLELVANRYKILEINNKLSIDLNIKSESLSSQILRTGEPTVDSTIAKINKSLILWVRADHCNSCVKSIYNQISKYISKKDFKIIILTNFESNRELIYFKSQFPKNLIILNTMKGYPNLYAFNISMPVMFLLDEGRIKHFIISDKNFPFLTKQYLEIVYSKYFANYKE